MARMFAYPSKVAAKIQQFSAGANATATVIFHRRNGPLGDLQPCPGEASASSSGSIDIEVQHLSARTELVIERNRRRIAMIRLDEDDISAASGRDPLQLFD